MATRARAGAVAPEPEPVGIARETETVSSPGLGAEKYGRYYWRVRLTAGRSLWLHADTATVEANGALVFRHTQKADGVLAIIAAYSAGAWVEAYAASVLDGRAVGVEHDG